MAFALNKSENELQMNGLSLTNFSYSDNVTVEENTTISDVIFRHMNETNFHGVSVSILHVQLINEVMDDPPYLTEVARTPKKHYSLCFWVALAANFTLDMIHFFLSVDQMF